MSTVDFSRAQRNSWISASLTGVHSLRADEQDGSFPSALSDFTLQRRFLPAILGGTGGFELQTHTTYRPSTNPVGHQWQWRG